MLVTQNFSLSRQKGKIKKRAKKRKKQKSYDLFFRSFESVKEKYEREKMIAYDTATEDHVFQMINELYRGDGASRDEVNQWLQG